LYARVEAKEGALNGEFGGRDGKARDRGQVVTLPQARSEGGLCLGYALAAAGAHAQLPREVPHARRAAFYCSSDMSIGNGFAYAYDHGSYNERECE